MTEAEKLIVLRNMLAPDVDTDEVLTQTLRSAESLVLNRMYPFGYKEPMAVPSRYEQIQLQLAVELYSKRGADGQTEHQENGTKRVWPEKSRLLSMIMPHCGGVTKNA